jgi:hypothetical protein
MRPAHVGSSLRQISDIYCIATSSHSLTFITLTMEFDQASLHVLDNAAPETKPCDCSMGSLPATESRNLIVCIDGTSNKFGTKVGSYVLI